MTSVFACPLPMPAKGAAAIAVAPSPPRALDTERLQMLYDRHAHALLTFAERFTTHESAQDAVQETFLRAWRSLTRLRGEPEALRPWLYTVLRRVLIDAHRTQRDLPIGGPDDVVSDRGVDGGYEYLLDRWRLEHALALLSASHRQVLIEVYYRGTSSEQLAACLGIPAGTVRSRLHYALRALRHQLADTADTANAAVAGSLPPGRGWATRSPDPNRCTDSGLAQ